MTLLFYVRMFKETLTPMSLGKKTLKLVKSVITDPKKRALYTPAELAYMEVQYERLKARRQARKAARKAAKGFGN